MPFARSGERHELPYRRSKPDAQAKTRRPTASLARLALMDTPFPAARLTQVPSLASGGPAFKTIKKRASSLSSVDSSSAHPSQDSLRPWFSRANAA